MGTTTLVAALGYNFGALVDMFGSPKAGFSVLEVAAACGADIGIEADVGFTR